MINMVLYVVVIPIMIYAVTSYVNRRFKVRKNTIWLVVASLLFSLSLFLPSPVINGIDTEFWTHFFGGGFFIGLLYVYFQPLIKRDLKWYQEIILLFMLVSTFGVINELYELFAQQVGIFHESLEDASWDLLANTLGVITFYVLYRSYLAIKTLFISR